MKTNKAFAELTTFIVVFACIMGTIYVLGLKKKPLKHKSLPETILSWIDQIDTMNTDMGFINVGNGPYDWNNDDDIGSIEENGFACIDYDPNFIVYYREDPAGVWKQRAETVLNEANLAMPDLAQFMGAFPAPASFYGRRLPIYLADSEVDYTNTATKLIGRPGGGGSAGLYIHGYGLHGPIAYGIILNPKTFPDYPDSYNSPYSTYHYVLRHEMNHYVFFSNLEYDDNSAHRTWEYEGLADFFSYNLGDKTQFVTGTDSIAFIQNRCNLSEDFPNDDSRFYNSEYWAGESFYKFLKEAVGEERTSRFVRYLYMEPFSQAITHVLPDIDDVHSAWVNSLVHRNH